MRGVRRNWIVAGITGLVTFFIGASISGIIGNRSDNLFLWIINQIGKSITLSTWPWIITFIALVVSLGLALYSLRHNRILNHALALANQIVDLDDSLLRLLASWIPTKNHEDEMQRLLAELLRDANAVFAGHVYRALILLPDEQAEDLMPWAHVGMPQETLDHIRFHVGSDKSKKPLRGVAGESYLERKLRVTHVITEDKSWRTDCLSFIRFTEGDHLPPYRSFVCVPVIGADPKAPTTTVTTCLGVAVFDSMNSNIFDLPESQIVLRTFARRIAAVLLIYRLLP
jgi:hypothetical protein